jgi:hypothetical protein
MLSAILPEGLLDHFVLVDFKELGALETKKDCFHIYLDEKNTLSKEYDSSKY